MNMSAHATTRARQRSIPPLIIEWLEAYGEEIHDHRGGIIHHFTKKSRRKLEKIAGTQVVRQMTHWLNAYLVRSVDNGQIITVGYRFKQVKH
ncbi:MAG: hypothetical protein WCV99_19935 [Sterolibacterium sp.]|jgi:hypothetical protein